MKSAKDPRHKNRVLAVKELFAWEFNKSQKPQLTFSKNIIDNLEKIDKFIQKCAPGRPINQINKVDLVILRLAVFELALSSDEGEPEKNATGKTPYKVVIDEAVEIAKEYGSDSSAGFVNGVLGNLVDSLKLEDAK
jgi:transcription antitermination protein NusB